jgi:hypothetical protein
MPPIMEPTTRDANVKWQQIGAQGYSVQSFLDPSEVEALRQLYLATIPEVSSPFFLSVFLPADVRKTILEGFHAILDNKLAEFVPGFKMVGASFVMKKAESVGSRMALHQDCSLVDQDKHLGINVWVPLCDVDSSNGCLCVVDYSQRFNKISCLPPLHGAHANFERELPATCITSLPMEAGEACLFDARVLHRSGDNHSTQDRVAAFFNLIPDDQPIRVNLRNPQHPERLEVYHTDSDFILQLNPMQYPDASQRERLTFVEFIEFSEPKLSMSEFAAVNPNLSRTPPAAIENAETVQNVEVVETLRARLWKLFQRGRH